MATFYLPSKTGYYTVYRDGSEWVCRYRIELIEGSINTSNRTRNITCKLIAWKVNTTVETTFPGSCFFKGSLGNKTITKVYPDEFVLPGSGEVVLASFEGVSPTYDAAGNCTINVEAGFNLGNGTIYSYPQYQGGAVTLSNIGPNVLPLKFNNQDVKSIKFNGTTVKHLIYNGKQIF